MACRVVNGLCVAVEVLGCAVDATRGEAGMGVAMGDAAAVRVGIGTCAMKDAHAAGREAAAAAMAPLAGAAPGLVLVFATPRFDLPALLGGVRSVTGDALLVGCTGSGEIAGGRYLGFGGGVGVLCMTAGPYRFGVASARDLAGDLDAAGQALARRALDAAGPSPHAAALLLTDSLLGDLQRFVEGVYRVSGARVALAGGAAGDEQRFVASSIFHGGEVLPRGALVVWIASPRPLRVVARHGWAPVSPPLLVTRAEGTRILELGGRPAADAYQAQLGLPEPLTPESFWATSIRHPFGVVQPDGAHVMRVARAMAADGSLTIQGCVPAEGSVAQVMGAAPEALLAVSGEVAREALAAAPGAGVLLAFSCAARATVLGPRAPEEARILQEVAGGVPAFGFHCCGEFARTSGVLATHNLTLVGVAL